MLQGKQRVIYFIQNQCECVLQEELRESSFHPTEREGPLLPDGVAQVQHSYTVSHSVIYGTGEPSQAFAHEDNKSMHCEPVIVATSLSF